MTGLLTAKNVFIISVLHVKDVCCRVLEMTQRIDLEETEEEESVDGLLYQVTFGPLLYQVQYFLFIES